MKIIIKKNIRQIQVYTILLLVLNSCVKECPNVNYYLPEAYNKFIPYKVGDTIQFIDKNKNEEFYLTCVYRGIEIDSSYTEDYYCLEGGYYNLNEVLRVNLFSDFPFVDNTLLKINLIAPGFELYFYPISKTYINVAGNYENHYYLMLDSIKSMLYDYNSYNEQYYNCIFFDSLYINTKCYYNVSVIIEHLDYFYDSIFINNNGILKLVSLKYDYDIEITE